MRTDELDYDLPQRLIATQPAQPRDSARLMVYQVSSNSIEHCRISDLLKFLNSGDALVLNNTAVTPARIQGVRADTNGRVEGLFLENTSEDTWLMMLRSNGKLRQGIKINLHTSNGQLSQHSLVLFEKRDAQWVGRLISSENTEEVLEEVGLTPLPPYILKARDEDELYSEQQDREWYQTVYADLNKKYSVAAPTAGLHFTPALLDEISENGIEKLNVTLHVGAGTFQPISTNNLVDHKMHEEYFEVSHEMLRQCQSMRNSGGRVIAVGTTSVRAMESINPAALGEHINSDQLITGRTDLLIYPPYEFKWIDGLLTNFHLPNSTLLALVSALIGLKKLKALYEEAIEQEYRFYSFGDAMLILP